MHPHPRAGTGTLAQRTQGLAQWGQIGGGLGIDQHHVGGRPGGPAVEQGQHLADERQTADVGQAQPQQRRVARDAVAPQPGAVHRVGLSHWQGQRIALLAAQAGRQKGVQVATGAPGVAGHAAGMAADARHGVRHRQRALAKTRLGQLVLQKIQAGRVGGDGCGIGQRDLAVRGQREAQVDQRQRIAPGVQGAAGTAQGTPQRRAAVGLRQRAGRRCRTAGPAQPQCAVPRCTHTARAGAAFSVDGQQRVGGMHLRLTGAARLAHQVQRMARRIPAGLQKQLAESRMGGVGSGTGQHRLKHRHQGQRAGMRRRVAQRDAAQLHIVFGSHPHFGMGTQPVSFGGELSHRRAQAGAVVPARARRRLCGQ